MHAQATQGAPGLMHRVTVPLALLVALVVVAAWYVTWSSTDFMMMVMSPMATATDPVALTIFFALLVVMMIAMMLPAALPMILAFHGLTRMEAGQPTKPADLVATASFVLPYFLVWGRRGLTCTKPLGAKPDDSMYTWLWSVLKFQIGSEMRKGTRLGATA